MTTPQRFTKGVTNVASDNPMNQLIIPDPTSVHLYYNDFDNYVAGDWIVTETNAAATEALTDADGGALLITNTAVDDDLVGMQLAKESFVFASGKKLWFKARLTLGDATQADCVVGLHVTDTSPVASAPSDGVYFRKDDGDTNWDFMVRASSVDISETAAIGAASTNAIALAFYFDGVDTFGYYVDGVKKGSVTTTSFPTTELNLSFCIQNGEAVAKTLTVDYVMSCKER